MVRRLGRRLALVSFSVELHCPNHGLERFNIKVVKRPNISADAILPKLRKKPQTGEISTIYVGRNVSAKEAERYLIGYFRERNLLEKIVKMRLVL